MRYIVCCGRRLAALSLALCLATPALAGPLEEGLQAAKEKDWKKAHELWKPLAEAGDPKAQFYLAGQYERGLGVERDEKRSLEWLRKSAEGGLSLAQFNYANTLFAAKTEAGYKGAVAWWTKAADQGFFPAQYNLAMAYQEGLGVKQDLDKALHWYQKAGENGSEPAKEAVQRLQEKKAGGKAPVAAAKAEAPTPAAKERSVAAEPVPSARPAEGGSLATPAAGGAIDWIKAQPPGNHTLQAASMTDEVEAKALAAKLSEQGATAVFPFRKDGAIWYSVILGSYSSPAQAKLEAKRLQGVLKKEPWVRRFDGIQAAIVNP